MTKRTTDSVSDGWGADDHGAQVHQIASESQQEHDERASSEVPSLTERQRIVLEAAAERQKGSVCPTRGLHGGAQTAVLSALRKRGLITEGSCPIITAAGRLLVGPVPPELRPNDVPPIATPAEERKALREIADYVSNMGLDHHGNPDAIVRGVKFLGDRSYVDTVSTEELERVLRKRRPHEAPPAEPLGEHFKRAHNFLAPFDLNLKEFCEWKERIAALLASEQRTDYPKACTHGPEYRAVLCRICDLSKEARNTALCEAEKVCRDMAEEYRTVPSRHPGNACNTCADLIADFRSVSGPLTPAAESNTEGTAMAPSQKD